ncbi:MAG TPA: VIT and VWA domain-containing protein [Pirellulales bacterium]|nr:VIT and VWA domain-containing protein [Pirellulales bacterium]
MFRALFERSPRGSSWLSWLLLAWAIGGALLLLPDSLLAQGLLVNVNVTESVRLPRMTPVGVAARPAASSYKLKEIDVHAKLVDQVAKVQVSQSFVNTGSVQMEVCFLFPLPYDGAIDQLTLLVDGKEFPAKLLAKDEARRTYEAIVRKNKDPALLEWIGTGMFQTSVFPVPPGAERKVTLRYSQLCRKSHNLTDFLFPLSTAKYTCQPVEKLKIEIAIESQGDIKNVYSPTHAIELKRDTHHATAIFKAENQTPSSDFRLLFDIDSGKLGTSVVSYRPKADDDGYFLLLTSPEIKRDPAERPKKTVLFVVDRSGSMSGVKIEQAKGALKFVLNNLREGDLFNVIAYDSAVESFRPELQKFDDETRKAALGFVEGLYAGGSTNIDGALTTALAQLQDSARPNYVLFMTDGLPTAGERNEMKIVANSETNNRVRARIAAFGVGYDVNSRLLDKLARQNSGQSEYVRPDENIEERVSRLYNKIEAPVMTDVAIKFAIDELPTEAGEPVNRLYPKKVFDLFEGDQLVLVGRYKRSGAAKVTVAGNVGSKRQSFDFPAELTAQSKDETFAFVEKLWALRRVGEIIDELDLKGQNQELVKELVELSTRHGIMTPYTSFLADENVDLRGLARNATTAQDRLGALNEAEGQSGFEQREFKGRLQSARQAAPAGAAGDRFYSLDKSNRAGIRGEGRRADAAKPGLRLSTAELAQGVQLGGVSDLGSEAAPQAAVKQVGAKAFYRRGKRWVDADVTEEQEKKSVRLKQFSDDYFKLAERHGGKLSQYLAFDEAVLVNLDGQAYLIEPEE